MRCGHAADASLAPANPPTLCGASDAQRRVPGSFEDFGATRGQIGAAGWSAQAGVCAGLTDIPRRGLQD
jgi:hypothetical protein